MGAELDRGIEALFRSEYEPMYRLAYTIVRSDAAAEEIVQDAFLAVADRWGSVENQGGYLRVSVVNGARSRLRTRGSHEQAERRIAAEARTAVSSGDVPYLLDVVDALPERQRLAVMLTYYAQLNSTEVGDVMDCPPGSVRSLVHRALERLAEVVER